jgi:hypothetical protein
LNEEIKIRAEMDCIVHGIKKIEPEVSLPLREEEQKEEITEPVNEGDVPVE